MKAFFMATTFVALYVISFAQQNTTASLQPLFTSYNKLKNALVKDDAKGAASNAAQFITALDAVNVAKLSTAEATALASLRDKLKHNATHISQKKELDHQREHFAALSQDMYALLQSASSLPQTVYYDYCPMQKAYWLSTEKVIQNPYYGKAMLSCGAVEKTVAPKAQSLQMNDGPMDHSSYTNDTTPAKPMQHDMHGMNTQDESMDMPNMNGMGKMETMNMAMDNMSHSFSPTLPMSRNGSGTGWMPDAAPIYGAMYHAKSWMYMVHYNLFLRYNNQDISGKGSRGDDGLDAPNWLMFMGQRKVGSKGLFHFNTMFSLDAVTLGNDGYPLLFQSGEAYKGKPIVDRQHPHDLFSELSVSYAQALSKKADVFLYLAYPGEPALGPVAFMHRPSALYNPDAPLSHHWADATHITFGVATLGVRLGDVKLEGSSFTGREPNEHRFDFDRPRFDSWSGRLSYNPSKSWALQVSHGFIKSPEELHAEENVARTTASAIYSLPLANNGWFNAIALWGQNKIKEHDAENAFLLEGSWRKRKLAIHTRYEYVQKSLEELALNEATYGHDAVFPVNAFTLGFSYDLLNMGKSKLAGGSQATLYKADNKLNSLYGKNPMAVEVYLRFYPSLMKM